MTWARKVHQKSSTQVPILHVCNGVAFFRCPSLFCPREVHCTWIQKSPGYFVPILRALINENLYAVDSGTTGSAIVLTFQHPNRAGDNIIILREVWGCLA
jgi:hypothetical protein